ncbi:MAG: PDZ domain-containing protein, partial [Candidatus Hinthialibacter sp.]
EKEQCSQVTSDMFDDDWPTFDRKGDFLFFTSTRNFTNFTTNDAGWSYVYTDAGVLMAAPLRKDVKNPFEYKNDAENWDQEDKKDSGDEDEKKDDDLKKDQEKDKDQESCQENEKDDKDGEKDDSDQEEKKEKKDKEEEKKPLEIDLEGFEARAFPLPVGDGGFRQLSINDGGQLIYVHSGLKANGGKTDIKIFDMEAEKKEEKTVLSDMGGYSLSADGKKLAVRKGGQFHIIDAKADQKLEDPISTNDMTVLVDPRAEWRQMFRDGWRIMRDFFYDPNMHGVDWQGMYDHYVQMLDDCASREDLSFVIDEMIAELNVGHAYNRGNPDLEDEPSESVGMLGADFELHDGAFRIRKIYRGASWDYDARSPLDVLPPDKLEEGDYILAVNRQPLDPKRDPWAAFVGLANKTVTLTVNDKPEINDQARDVNVKLISNEANLRYRDWIEQNRAYVDKKTDGQVGYIYVPNTAGEGNNDLFRQYYGQIQKKALIIDERWNGGGYIPIRMIELLNRPVLN